MNDFTVIAVAYASMIFIVAFINTLLIDKYEDKFIALLGDSFVREHIGINSIVWPVGLSIAVLCLLVSCGKYAAAYVYKHTSKRK